MNMSIELNRICDRLDELATYAEHKMEQAAEQKKTGMSRGLRQSIAIKKRRDENAAVQAKEELENLADQQQENAQPDVVEENDAGSEPSKAE